jgi:hypothetical protein
VCAGAGRQAGNAVGAAGLSLFPSRMQEAIGPITVSSNLCNYVVTVPTDVRSLQVAVQSSSPRNAWGLRSSRALAEAHTCRPTMDAAAVVHE